MNKQIEEMTQGEIIELLLDVLRELHDFAEVSSHYKKTKRSKKAFKKAAELLQKLEKPEENNSTVPSLHEACLMMFSGVGAISPKLYSQKLNTIAKITVRVNDQEFRNEVAGILRTFPCPLD